ncbi:MAG TPA: oxygen-independent coproporphyrinogen III oxidase-like protein [Gammaproteobacteria bacterium]|nr:oxygen-independent coproporphyrinogen III oxidase-like protein [Gammaproteobacteria bacterium]
MNPDSTAATSSPGPHFRTTPPLSLYVHLPWCLRKCPYCDFNSHTLPAGSDQGEQPEADYIAALLADLETELPLVWGRTVQSIFIGGGTPSLLSAAAIETLLDGIRARLALKPDAEITLEANPGTAEAGRFAAYRAAGINRLSLGVQSLNDAHLRALGRIHDASEARNAVVLARRAGFERINLDLMFGLPHQTPGQAMEDLAQVLALEPEHLSWYQLTLEPNTAFYHAPPPRPDADTCCQIQEQGQTILSAAGFRQYEVSAWARSGEACRHNLNYWRFGDYIGIGAGAHGKITDAAAGGIRRRRKKRHPRDYLAATAERDFLSSENRPTAADLVFEFALNHLRLREPLRVDQFETACGLPGRLIRPRLDAACADGLLQQTPAGFTHTELGWRFLDDLVGRFLPEPTPDANSHGA